MAGLPAYQYNHGSAAPRRNPYQSPKSAPRIKVVPGTGRQRYQALSPQMRFAISLIAALLISFLCIGCARVFIASEAYGVASQASQLRSDISQARSEQEALAVEKSSIANPITLRNDAQERLHMSAPTKSEAIVLPEDVVITDGAGNLSLSGSVAQVARIS